jgi:DNA-binding NarL/FixJ family response regulator
LTLRVSRPIADDRLVTTLSPKTSACERGTVTVCLVESYPVLRELLCDLLVQSGAVVVSAVGTRLDGEAAISYHRPDVAVIDSRLPDGRGVELIRTVARTAPGVAVLLHSGAATHADAREAIQAGAAGILLKSIRGDSLIEAIRTSAGARRGPVSLGSHRPNAGRAGQGAAVRRPFGSGGAFRPRP